jgi:hypothetical protein
VSRSSLWVYFCPCLRWVSDFFSAREHTHNRDRTIALALVRTHEPTRAYTITINSTLQYTHASHERIRPVWIVVDNGTTGVKPKGSASDWQTEWHVYAVEWSEDSLDFYLDDVK